ncbi:TPA: DUF551 domain-containing protein [Escherichia coli]|nr:DUF551 domain-containing protein [Escherichia coli]HCO3884119.1 DUF551 domain-containing protein [Escherichia coli]
MLAGMSSEPVAWRWNYGGTTTWRLLDTKPMPGTNPNRPRVIEPLYTAPPAPVAVPDLKPVGFLFVSNDGAVTYSPADWPMKGFNLIGPIYGDVNACRTAMQAEPVSAAYKLPGGWIKCSELMPCTAYGVLVATPWASAPGGYAMKWATYCPWHPDSNEEGWIIPGASWKPTHWMPLPAAPEQEV